MKIYKSKETIYRIKKTISENKSGAYLRFGDGDFLLAEGAQDKMQNPSEKLSFEMRESIGINGENIFKSIPLYCSKYGMDEPNMKNGTFLLSSEDADKLLSIAKKYWGGEIKDVYSHVALHYTSVFDEDVCLEFLRFLKNVDNIVLIGNENVPDEIKISLFGSNRPHIKTTPKNAYENIDRVETELKSVIGNEYTVIVTFMGCSGRVLQKRLYNTYDNVFLFDFGSLMDAVCGWVSRTWIRQTNVNNSILEKI